ncbi:hypothetical protein [Hyalangium gracile]|uniref:hypothetical protein n=1 Tax=Hyalangium gracile TaxID=394092 RepID=UPI001CCD3AD1|nr:hypothetical protein [Hyalangium gracile]
MTQSVNTARIEVLGNALLSAMEAMRIAPDRALRIFAEHGIARPEKTAWYPFQGVLGAYRDILKQIGPNTMRAVGRNIPKNAEFPPDLRTVEQALQSLDTAYHMNHRGPGHIGGYRYESTGPRSARMVCDNPYPCPMDEGLVESLADRFRPKDSFFIRLQHDAASCRERGDAACAYLIAW